MLDKGEPWPAGCAKLAGQDWAALAQEEQAWSQAQVLSPSLRIW